MAGLIDGEGCILISKTKIDGERKTPSYNLVLQIAQKNGGMIDWLYGNFGGNISSTTRKQSFVIKGKIETKEYSDYRWRLRDLDKLLYILKRVLPFSIEKKKQIQEAINYIFFAKSYKKTMLRIGSRTEHRSIQEANRFIEKSEYFLNKLQQLKKEKTLCAAVETKSKETSNEVKL